MFPKYCDMWQIHPGLWGAPRTQQLTLPAWLCIFKKGNWCRKAWKSVSPFLIYMFHYKICCVTSAVISWMMTADSFTDKVFFREIIKMNWTHITCPLPQEFKAMLLRSTIVSFLDEFQQTGQVPKAQRNVMIKQPLMKNVWKAALNPLRSRSVFYSNERRRVCIFSLWLKV